MQSKLSVSIAEEQRFWRKFVFLFLFPPLALICPPTSARGTDGVALYFWVMLVATVAVVMLAWKVLLGSLQRRRRATARNARFGYTVVASLAVAFAVLTPAWFAMFGLFSVLAGLAPG